MKIDQEIKWKYIRGELKGSELREFESLLAKNPREKEKIENLKVTHVVLDELTSAKYIKEDIPEGSQEKLRKKLEEHENYIKGIKGTSQPSSSNNFLVFFTNIKQNFTKVAAPALVTGGIIVALISPTYQIATRGGSSQEIAVSLLSSEGDKIQTRGATRRDDNEQSIKIALSKVLGKDAIDEKLEDIEDKINTVQQSLDNNSTSDIVIDNTTIKISAKNSFVSKNGDSCRLLELNNTKEKKKLSFVACKETIVDWNFYYFTD